MLLRLRRTGSDKSDGQIPKPQELHLIPLLDVLLHVIRESIEHVLTSAMKRVDVAAQDISKAVAEGNFTAGIHMYDLSNGGVDLAPTRDHIPADVLEVVEAAKAAIINGEKSVPTSVADCPEFTLAG